MMTFEQRLKQKIAEQKKSLALFDIILQNIDDGISVLNENGELVYENEEAERMRLKYFSLNARIHDENGKSLHLRELPTFTALADEQIHKQVIEIIKSPKSSSVWLRVKAVPVFNKHNTLVYVVGTWRDVTGRIMEEKRRNHFIAIGSHELRTPLAGIKVLNQVLHKLYQEGKYDKALNFFSKIDAKVNMLTKIVQDFIEVEKIRGEKLEFAPESFDFADLVRATVQDLNTIYTSHTIELHGDTHIMIIADKMRIQEVLNNLINNARKYSPHSDKIDVIISHDDKTITTAVKDYGVGLKKKYAAKIFQPFYRIKDPSIEKVHGLGLGLYISYKIVELHGGRMWLKSKIGSGSIFYFSLPRVIKKTKKSYDF
jgi:signal transduction histidine kinase